ncbi:MAG: response regulator [Magnetococcales bacterium]|nr:response regulator [Magnetococcales bacterium]
MLNLSLHLLSTAAVIAMLLFLLVVGIQHGLNRSREWRWIFPVGLLIIASRAVNLIHAWRPEISFLDSLEESLEMAAVLFGGLGMWRWMPLIAQHYASGEALRQAKAELEVKVSDSLQGLRASLDDRERLLQALDQHAIVSATDPQGRITYVNDQFVRMSQYPREELLGKNHRLLNSGRHPPEFFQRLWDDILAGRVWNGVVCNRSRDGSLYWQNATIVPFLDEGGKPYQFIAIRTNITDQIQTEERLEALVRQRTAELEATRDQALQANRAKSEFLAAMSHEIRTPLNVVLGMLELLDDDQLEAQKRDYARIAGSSGRGLLHLINDILDFSKIEAGRFNLDMVDFDLRDLLDEIALTMAPLAHAKGLELTAFLPSELQTNMRGDPNRLRQIFTNLLSNAIKFTPRGGAVELYGGPIDRDDQSVEFLFEVRDSGVGIPPEKREMIFQHFTQAHTGNTREYGGTGLGLAISKRLVELMEGEIGVEERPDAPNGSVFFFTVRLKTQSRAPSAAAPLEFHGERVLGVGSSGLQAALLDNFFTGWGARIDQVHEIETAAALLRKPPAGQRPYRLVIVNQQPGQGSRQDLSLLNKPVFKNLRYILLTDLMDQGCDIASALPGAALCLQKPFSADRLRTAVRQLLSASLARHCATPPPSSPRSADSTAGYAGSVLLVDDQEANLKVANAMLLRLGCDRQRVHAARGGLEALALFQAHSFDLVLMDCQMPGMDGYETTRQIRAWEQEQNRPPTPVIAFTADITPAGREACEIAGMNGFLDKPVMMQSLKAQLDRFAPLAAPAPEPTPVTPATPSLPEVDVVAAMQITGLPEETFLEVAEVILSQLTELLESLERDVMQREVESAAAKSHVLKGSMANSIFAQIKEPSAALHARILRRDGDWAEIQRLLNALKQSFEPIREALNRFVRSHKGG